VVGVWKDHYAPYVGQWVKVPLDRANPEECPIVPCHGHKPMEHPNIGLTQYIIAKRVPGQPDLAVVEAWSYSLKDALEKAEEVNTREGLNQLGIGGRKPPQPQAKEPLKEPTQTQLDREDVAVKAFRPFPVEKLPVPQRQDREWAIVGIVDVHGQEGA